MSTDPAGQAAKDGREWVSLFREADEYFGLSSSRKRRRTQKELLRDLGEWASQARDEHHRWLRPSLSAKSFERHLRARNGYLNPSKTCIARFGWARLLHALNIHPAARVVDWILPTEKIDPTEGNYLYMELDGVILCHIINLYRLYPGPDPRFVSSGSTTRAYDLSFGVLITHDESDAVKVTFEPRDTQSVKLPFQYKPKSNTMAIPGDHLYFKPQEVITNYLDFALEMDVSDPKMALPGEKDDTLTQRARALVAVLQNVRGRSPNEPYLVTASWLEQASRIYRRITTNSSESLILPREVVAALQTKANETKYVQEFFEGKIITWERAMEQLVSKQCMLPSETLGLVWTDGTELSAPQSEVVALELLQKEFESVLASFRAATPNSLLNTLAGIPDVVKYLLTCSEGLKLVDTPGVMLELTKESPTWDSKCQIVN